MMIRIEIPESKDGVQTSCGIKVFTEGGHEVKDVYRIELDIQPNEIITAKITVAVSGANFENLNLLLGDLTLEQAALASGYRLRKPSMFESIMDRIELCSKRIKNEINR